MCLKKVVSIITQANPCFFTGFGVKEGGELTICKLVGWKVEGGWGYCSLHMYHMNPVEFIYRIGRMCSVQQESRAFSSDRNSAPEDSIKTLIVLL